MSRFAAGKAVKSQLCLRLRKRLPFHVGSDVIQHRQATFAALHLPLVSVWLLVSTSTYGGRLWWVGYAFLRASRPHRLPMQTPPREDSFVTTRLPICRGIRHSFLLSLCVKQCNVTAGFTIKIRAPKGYFGYRWYCHHVSTDITGLGHQYAAATARYINMSVLIPNVALEAES